MESQLINNLLLEETRKLYDNKHESELMCDFVARVERHLQRILKDEMEAGRINSVFDVKVELRQIGGTQSLFIIPDYRIREPMKIQFVTILNELPFD